MYADGDSTEMRFTMLVYVDYGCILSYFLFESNFICSDTRDIICFK